MSRLPSFSLPRFGAPAAVCGLDLEPGHATAAVVSVGDRVRVERAATIALPAGAVGEGEVADPAALAAALRELFERHDLPRRVRLGVAGARVVIRTIDLPPIVDAKELASAVRFRARDELPMPLDQAVLDFHSAGVVETPEGPRTRVVAVAARRDLVEGMLDTARAAGLRVVGVDAAAFAIIRALRDPSHDGAGSTLYAHIGGVVTLAVADGSLCRFARTVPGGMDAAVETLAERRYLEPAHAAGWLLHTGLETPLTAVDGEPGIVREARAVLEETARRVADQARSTLQVGASGAVGRIVVGGPGAAIAGMAEALGAELGLPAEVAEPAEHHAGALGEVTPGRAVVAAGLACEEGPA